MMADILYCIKYKFCLVWLSLFRKGFRWRYCLSKEEAGLDSKRSVVALTDQRDDWEAVKL